MKITVQYFAVLRETINVSEESVELPEGSTGQDLLFALSRLHPSFEPFIPSLRLASETSFLVNSEELTEGSQILVIPPVSGG